MVLDLEDIDSFAARRTEPDDDSSSMDNLNFSDLALAFALIALL
jgi:hypothetical protein